MSARYLPIEDAIRAMVVDELPKARARGAFGAPGFGKAAWSGVAAFGELMTIVDENAYGLAPSHEEGAPHPDAIALWRAVQRLGQIAVADLDWFEPVGADESDGADATTAAILAARAAAIDALTARDHEGDAVLVHPVSRELVRFALRMDGAPAPVLFRTTARVGRNGHAMWQRPVTVTLTDERGRAVERVVWEGANAPKTEAHALRKGWRPWLDVAPDPDPIVLARLRHALLLTTMTALAGDVALLHRDEVPDGAWEGVADRRRWRIMPPALSAQPWLDRVPVIHRVAAPGGPRVLAVRRIGRVVYHQVATADLEVARCDFGKTQAGA